MEANTLIACARRLFPGQTVQITFRPGGDGISGLRRLIGATRSSRLTFDGRSNATVSIVLESGQWGNFGRTVTVFGLETVHEDFLKPAARDIEAIAASQHYAYRLFTNSVAKRHKAFDEICSEVVNQNLKGELGEWGASCQACLEEIDGLPNAVFEIYNDADKKTIVSVAIDGFTGRAGIKHPGKNWDWLGRRFSTAENVQERIYSATMDAIDAMATA